jgi:hypothetical protein
MQVPGEKGNRRIECDIDDKGVIRSTRSFFAVAMESPWGTDQYASVENQKRVYRE